MVNTKNKAYNNRLIGFFNILFSYVLMYVACDITFNNLTIFPFSYPTTFLMICSICIGMISYAIVHHFIKTSNNRAYVYSTIFCYLILLILSFLFILTYIFILPQLLVVLLLFPAIIIQTILFSCNFSFRSINNK